MATQIAVDGTPTNGANPWIDALVMDGAWGPSYGTPNITVFFDQGSDPFGGYWIGNSYSWQSYEIAAFEEAFAIYESFIDIEFTVLSFANSISNPANIHYWLLNDTQIGGSLGWHEVPNNAYGDPLFSAMNFQGTGWDAAGLAQGGYGFETIIHELGHGIGLAHPHDGGGDEDGNLFPGVTAAFDDFGDYNLNQGVYTIMSYNSGWVLHPDGALNPLSADNYGWDGTPMALDIAALQETYGPNTTYASGNDVYILPEVNASGTFFSSIWDTGGVDRISAADFVVSVEINLNDASLLPEEGGGGFISWADGIYGGYTIANGVIIENATGGKANDVIIGNEANNNISGGSGADQIEGGDGYDTLSGNNGSDFLYGGAGNDTINGMNGADTMYGGDGDDVMNGAVSGDTMYGEAGDDTLSGGAGGDALYGGADNDILTGAGGIDDLWGGDGDDTLSGGTQSDYLDGQNGNDTLNGQNGADYLFGGAGVDRLNGGNGDDTLAGGAGNDTLYGGRGNDTLHGDAGDDMLYGQAGNDYLNGWAGNDTIVSGGGYDEIYFYALGGDDTITDYDATFDSLHLDSDLFGGSTDILDYATDTGSDVLVTFITGDTLLFEGMASVNDLVGEYTII